MRMLLCILLLSCFSTSYAYDHCQKGAAGKGFCYQPYQAGYFFERQGNDYYPAYQDPKFFHQSAYYQEMPLDRLDEKANKMHGFYRCYDKQGLSIEYYFR